MEEENGSLLDELEEFFTVEDRDTSLDVCGTCSKLRNGTRVCGIFKPFDTYRKSKGHHDTEETFSCSEFVPE